MFADNGTISYSMAILTLDSTESATSERVTGRYTERLAVARVSCK